MEVIGRFGVEVFGVWLVVCMIRKSREVMSMSLMI